MNYFINFNNFNRRDLTVRVHHEIDNSSAYTSRRNSNSSTINSEPLEIAPHHVK